MSPSVANPGRGGPGLSWAERVVVAVERRWGWTLALLVVLSGALLLYMGRGLSFYYDDWNFVTEDYGGGLHSLLKAHVGNISIFPIAVYKVLFHLVGLNHYAVFRLVVVLLHLACGTMVFVLAARRISRVPALLAAALIFFLGAAWEDLLWAFQIGYLLSVAGGLAALVLLERRGRLGEVAAMLCLVVSAGSSSLGIAIMIGVAVELAWQRRWRSGWIVIIPACLYALWYLGYGESQITENGLINAPGFAEDLAAAAFGGLVGRGLEWGRPLALLGALFVIRRLSGSLPVSARLAGLIATGISLWVITGATRSTISQPETSRYIYLGAVVVVLGGVELLRGITATPRGVAVATVLVAVSAVTGLTVLHDGSMGLRATSKTVEAQLGALEMAAADAPPGYQPAPQGAPQITAGPYLHTVHAVGSTPADTPAELMAAEPANRAAADAVLVQLGVVKLTAGDAATPSPLAPAPATAELVGATEMQRGGCLHLKPLAGAQMTGAFVLPTGGVTLRDEGGASASLSVRRFGEAFDPLPSQVASRSAAVLTIPPDSAAVAWQLQIVSASTFEICGLLP